MSVPDMILDVVDENDMEIGEAPYELVHSRGLRHRSVQVFVFQKPELNNLLVVQRSRKQEVSALKLHPSAGGHFETGKTYEEGAWEQLHDELFYGTDLPSGITLVQVSNKHYPNDTRPTNKENTCLFTTVYSGPFYPNPQEIGEVYWQEREITWQRMQVVPQQYTTTFRNAMREFRRCRGEPI